MPFDKSNHGRRAEKMSLSLLQGYSSGEDEAAAAAAAAAAAERENDDLSPAADEDAYSSSSDGDEGVGGRRRGAKVKSPFDHPRTSSNSLLPSAFDVFSEIAGPPEFLNNSVVQGEVRDSSTRDADRKWRGRRGKHGREKKELPAGVVVQAKAQLVGIRDRVRSDVEGTGPPASGSASKPSAEGPRVFSASNPEPKDAADLLRMCVQCGIPKTYSHTRGMVCPVCGDRPPAGPNSAAEKKKGSTVKDKEKCKRMKGQSSHAAWKSETEMQLRQQFD